MTELALTDPDVLTGLCSSRTELSGGIAPGEQRIIRQALSLLDKCLREPGISFTSSHAVSDWLRLQMSHGTRGVYGDLPRQSAPVAGERSHRPSARLTALRCIRARSSGARCVITRRQ